VAIALFEYKGREVERKELLKGTQSILQIKLAGKKNRQFLFQKSSVLKN
jgi:hypothetical protein